MSRRYLLLALGVVLFGVGVVELREPGTVPLPAAGTLLTAFGGLVLLYSAVVSVRSRGQHLAHADTPDVEITRPARVPGTDLAETLDGFPGPEQLYSDGFDSRRRRLEEAAVAVRTRLDGLDTAQARESVRTGEWTDRRWAAAYLGEDIPEPDREVSLARLFATESARERNRLRTVDAIAAAAGIEGDDGMGESGPESDEAGIEGDDGMGESGPESDEAGEESDDGMGESGPESDEAGEESDDGMGESGPESGEAGDREPEVFAGAVEAGTAGSAGSGGGHERTGHWAGIGLVVLVCVGLGVLLEVPGVLLAGAVGLGYVAYARSTRPGAVDLSASRSVSDTAPDPGDTVEVTVTVTNNGGFCPDLRIVDGVPESLSVAGGSPRYGTALRAGESVTFSYTLRAAAGTHEFGPVLALTRNLSGSVERERYLDAASRLRAVPSPIPVQTPVPLRRQPTRYAGSRTTDTGGDGIEFRSVREYRPGDSLTRIDWNRRARTGELTTLEFNRERATRVVLLLDTRRSAHVGPDPAGPDAVERAVAGAQRLFPALLEDGHQVGIATFGAGERYLAPDTGRSHRRQGRTLLASEPAFHVRTGGYSRPWYWIPRLRRKLPSDTQLIVLSPLVDAESVRIVRQLEAYGYPTTVLSPDPTSTETPSHRLMRARRRLLLSALRGAGVPVLDWAASASLEELLTREVVAR
jgi:uncharacterized repeat protein (TIGR01451 family)